MENIEAVRILVNYKDKLEKDILDLRAKACEKAAIKRNIEKVLSSDDIKQLEEWDQLQSAYSIKGISQNIFNK